MLWYEYLIHYVGSVIGVFTLIHIYNLLYKKKSYTFKNIITILFIAIIFNINTLTNYTFSKIIIFYLLYVSCLKIIFKDNIRKILVSALIIYIVIMFLEILCGILLIFTPFENIKEVNNTPIFKFLISLLIMLIGILVFYLKKVKKLTIKIVDYLSKKDLIFIISLLAMIILFLSSITFKNALNYQSLAYLIINILIFVILITTFIISFYNILLKNKAEEKEEVLLNFIKKYEYLIDKDRINRHELLNNLLVIKSFKDKNSKEFSNFIDNLITEHKSTNSKIAHNLYNLPSGLKGLIYYKMYDMEKEAIQINTNISSKTLSKLDNLDTQLYTKICKIIGILLDNAIEASKEQEEKTIDISMYSYKNNLKIEIGNTADVRNINMHKINDKNYSSKGQNRGYGLFLVNKIIESNSKLDLNQEVNNNKFITTLTIYIK